MDGQLPDAGGVPATAGLDGAGCGVTDPHEAVTGCRGKLIARADTAMYTAKQQGRDQVVAIT